MNPEGKSPLREAVGASPPGAREVESAIDLALRAEEAASVALEQARVEAEARVLAARHEARRILTRADQRAGELPKGRERRLKTRLQAMIREKEGNSLGKRAAQPDEVLLTRMAERLARRLTGGGAAEE